MWLYLQKYNISPKQVHIEKNWCNKTKQLVAIISIDPKRHILQNVLTLRGDAGGGGGGEGEGGDYILFSQRIAAIFLPLKGHWIDFFPLIKFLLFKLNLQPSNKTVFELNQ